MAKLDENEAVRLFRLRAADARGEPVIDRGAGTVRAIVRLLDCNKAAVLLAAAQADRQSPSEILGALRALDQLAPPEPEVRKALARGDEQRRVGRLAEAERLLAKVTRGAKGDLFAEAEALRILGAVYRADGRLAEALEVRERALAHHVALGARAQVAIAWGDVGTSLASLGRLREARTFHERAIAAHRDLGRERDEGVEWSYLGVALHRAGRLAEARRAHEHALEIHSRTKHRRAEAADRMHLGYVFHEIGDISTAREHYESALEMFRRIGERSLEGVTLSYLGALEVEATHAERAGALLELALSVHREVKSKRHEAVTRLHISQHHLALGERDAVRRLAKEALRIAPNGLELEHHAWALALSGRLDRAAAVALEDEVTADAIQLLLLGERVRAGSVAVAAAHSAALQARGVEAVPHGSRRRIAIARLESVLHDELPKLLVAANGVRFVPPGATKVVDLGRRTPLIRILQRLVERRLAFPGAVSSADELLATAWPDERVMYEAGQIRVRNALAQLRKLGLRDAIATRGGGYLLDPAFPIATSL